MDFSDLECGICNNLFSDDHCPMILPCSHTFCSSCIDQLILNQRKTCPVCRERFTATASRELMISRIVLNMANQFSSMHLEAKSTSKSSKTPFRVPKGDLQEVINDFKKKITKDAIKDFQGTESQILGLLGIFDEMIAGVIKADKDIDRIMKELQEVKTLITGHLTSIHQNILIWKTNLAVVQIEKEKIHAFEEKLDNCESFKSVGVVMGEVEDVLQDSRGEISEFNRLLQENERERNDLEKELLNAEVRLKKVLEEAAKTQDVSPREDIMNNDLQSFSDAARGNLQKEIFVTKKFQGRQRVAQARKGKNNLLFVSHLKEGNVPLNCTSIEVDSLMKKSSRRAFLDFSYEETYLGRIIINVMDEGNLALNFLHMCAGDLGPSYANSLVYGVGNSGIGGEYIEMGEYIVQRGASRKAVLSGVDWNREQRREIYKETTWDEGHVWGLFGTEVASWVGIVTRALPNWKVRNCYGKVEEGLDILRDAILFCPNIERIRIKDCGLVFSL